MRVRLLGGLSVYGIAELAKATGVEAWAAAAEARRLDLPARSRRPARARAAALAGCAVGGVVFGPTSAGAFQDHDRTAATNTEGRATSESRAAGQLPGMRAGFWTEGFDPEAMAVQLEEWLAEQVAADTITQEDVDHRPGAIADAEFPAGGSSEDGP